MTGSHEICISATGHRALRLVLLVWFSAAGLGLLPWPQGQALAQAILPGDIGVFALHALVFALAVTLALTPEFRRPVPYLSLIVVCGAVHAKLAGARRGASLPAAAYWRDVVLLVGLMLTQLPTAAQGIARAPSRNSPLQDTPNNSPNRARLVRRVTKTAHLHPSGARGAAGRTAFAEAPDDMARSFARSLDLR